MAKIHEMMQRRAEITQEIRALMDRVGDAEMGGEDSAALARMEADFDVLDKRIAQEERQLARERAAGEVVEQAERAPVSGEAHRLFCDYLRTGDRDTLAAYNAISQDNPTQAGYLVAPEQFVDTLIKELDDELFMRNLATKFQLEGAQSLGFPKRTARMGGFSWGTEISEPTPDTSLAFGKREFIPRFFTGEIPVSRTLVRNSKIPVDRVIRDEMSRGMGDLMEAAYMMGDGTNQPLGIFTASDDGISTARDIATGNTTTAVTFDGLLDALFSIKAQYQRKLAWIFHRDVVKMLRKIKDADGQYIWQPSVVAGQPDMLFAKPVYQSEFAPNTLTAGLYAGIVGDFSQYWVCDGMDLEVLVLHELRARTNQVLYLTRMSTDGMPVLDECFARVKLAAS